jgi:hypothetical protein
MRHALAPLVAQLLIVETELESATNRGRTMDTTPQRST